MILRSKFQLPGISSKPYVLPKVPDLNKDFFHSDKLDVLISTAKQSGLNSDYLVELSCWIETKEINDETKLKLIECLIPECGGTVPINVTLNLTRLLKLRGTSMIVKVELLKWMISVYSLMEKGELFLMLYQMFLWLIEVEELRPYAAYFVFLSTHLNHVTEERVTTIRKFITKYGEQDYLKLIMHTYFTYNPDAFMEEEVIEYVEYEVESLGVYPSLIKNVHPAYKLDNCDNLLNIEENDSNGSINESVDIEEPVDIETLTFPEMYEQVKALEKCNNMSKILSSGLRKLYLTSEIDKKAEIKIHDYIASKLIQELRETKCLKSVIENNYELLRLQHSRPNVIKFNDFLMSQGRGRKWYPDTLELMCYEPICCFNKIQERFKYIQRSFLVSNDVAEKCQWLFHLSNMYCNWVLQSKRPIPCNLCSEPEGACGGEPDGSPDGSIVCHIPSVEISKLGKQIDRLCDLLAIQHRNNPFVLHEILMHYQMATTAHTEMENLTTCFPSRNVCAQSLMPLSPLILDTFGSLMLSKVSLYDLRTCELNMELSNFKSLCSDIYRFFLGGPYDDKTSYIYPVSYKELNEKWPIELMSFRLDNHPAFILAREEFGCKGDIINDEKCRQDFFKFLIENDNLKYFISFLTEIKTMISILCEESI